MAVQEINLSNLSKNYIVLSKLSKPGIVAAVIKANAYGCGLKETGKTLLKEGCKLFFVAKIDEGIELRKFLSKKSKIAVFDGYLDYQDSLWEEHDLIPVCNTIEQDADVVMFVFREEYYHEKAEPLRKSEETLDNYNERYENRKSYYETIQGQAQILIAKQRHGPTGNVHLSFTDRFTKFGNLIKNDNIPEGF